MTVFMIVSGVIAVGMVRYNMFRNEMRLQRAEQQLEEAREKYHTENQG